MDVLSQILLSVRLRLPLLTDLRLGEGMRLDMGNALEQPAPGVPFYYVVSGSPNFSTSGGAAIPSRGGFLLFPHWDQHFISVGTVTSDTHILDVVNERHIPLWSRDDDFPGILSLSIGSEHPAARVLCGIFSIDPTTSRHLFGERDRMIQLDAREADMDGLMRLSLDLVTSRHELSEPGFSAILCKCLELIFVQSARHWLLHAGQSPHWVKALNDRRLRRVIEAIHARPDRKWTLEELARIAGQSRSRFAEHFRSSLEQTPFEYIKWCRNHLAPSLLARRDLSIADVAEQLGYSSATTFAKNFAREFGMSPGQYRRRTAE